MSHTNPCCLQSNTIQGTCHTQTHVVFRAIPYKVLVTHTPMLSSEQYHARYVSNTNPCCLQNNTIQGTCHTQTHVVFRTIPYKVRVTHTHDVFRAIPSKVLVTQTHGVFRAISHKVGVTHKPMASSEQCHTRYVSHTNLWCLQSNAIQGTCHTETYDVFRAMPYKVRVTHKHIPSSTSERASRRPLDHIVIMIFRIRGPINVYPCDPLPPTISRQDKFTSRPLPPKTLPLPRVLLHLRRAYYTELGLEPLSILTCSYNHRLRNVVYDIIQGAC